MGITRRHKLKPAVAAACVFALLAGVASPALGIKDEQCLKCHGDRSLKRKFSDGMKNCLFLDRKKFNLSVHGDCAVMCTDCHADIKKLDLSAGGKKVPHGTELAPVKCLDCHSDQHDAFARSTHYKIRQKGISLSCYSCHKYHQVKYISGFSVPERKNAFCVKCHEPEKSHKWLPHKKRHFSRVDCSACHAPKAGRYVNLRIFDKTRNAFPTAEEILASLKTKDDKFMALVDLDKDKKIAAAEFENMFKIMRDNNVSAVLHAEILSELDPTVHEINADNAVRDCANCHKPSAAYHKHVSLSLVWDDNSADRHAVSGDVLRSFLLPDFYAMSATRTRVVDRYGVLLILVTVSAIFLHFLVRLVTVIRRRQKQRETTDAKPPEAVLMHSTATRVWHWTYAMSILVLLLTGGQIRYVDKLHLIPLHVAVVLHEIAGVLLLIAFVFWLAYNLVRGKIRDYIAHPLLLVRSGTGQAMFYLAGYFKGHPDPHQPTAENKFNILQKMAYGTTMFLMMPALIVTGLLLSDVEACGQWIEAFGGVKMVAAVHGALFFLMISFLLIHLYTLTMGKTLLHHIRAMITGYHH
jgi:thiosulfate reductase cytochrome b subunit